jgi:L-alanine-DL-glutamate epimerase-like enolase superfamily enzyme
MKVVDIAVEAYRLPPAQPWEDATNRVQALEFVIVTLTTDTKKTGVGLTYSVDVGGTAIKSLIEDYLGSLVIGADPLDYERIWLTLQRQSRRLGVGASSMAIAAIDLAVWDLIGKSVGLPLHKLLGGARPDIPAYISEINLSADDTVDALCGRIDGYRARGFDTVKIKIGHQDFERDLARLEAATRMLAPGRLLVDLNQKWSTAEARRHAADIDRFRLGWLEEPLIFDDVEGHAEIRSVLRTPIALGESLHSRGQILEFLRRGAVDVVQADVAFVGGVTEWLKIAHTAAAFGKVVAPHYMMEVSLQLLCGVSNSFMVEDVVGGSFSSLGLLAEPIEVVNARGVPSDRPGLGLVFDDDALRRVRLVPEDVRSSFLGGSK